MAKERKFGGTTLGLNISGFGINRNSTTILIAMLGFVAGLFIGLFLYLNSYGYSFSQWKAYFIGEHAKPIFDILSSGFGFKLISSGIVFGFLGLGITFGGAYLFSMIVNKKGLFEDKHKRGSKLAEEEGYIEEQEKNLVHGVVLNYPEDLIKHCKAVAEDLFLNEATGEAVSLEDTLLEIMQNAKTYKEGLQLINKRNKLNHKDSKEMTIEDFLSNKNLSIVRKQVAKTYKSSVNFSINDKFNPNVMPFIDHGLKLNNASINEHMLVIGAPGVGKSVLMKSIFRQWKMLKKNKTMKTILHDTKGDWYEETATEHDVIFNMNDQRSILFNPLDYMDKVTDVYEMCDTLIPKNEGEKEPVWIDTARAILFGVFQYCRAHNLKKISDIKRVSMWNPKKMVKEFKNIKDMELTIRTLTASDTQVQTYVSNFSTKFKLLNGLSDSYMDRTDSFDIIEWFEMEEQSTIYIINPMESVSLNAPRIGALIETIIKFWSRYSKRKDRKTKQLFLLIDEFGLLEKIEIISTSLKLLRSSGLVILLGFQSRSDIEERYGRLGVTSIFAYTGTKIIFRVGDQNIAEDISKLIGSSRQEITNISRKIGNSNDNQHTETYATAETDIVNVMSSELTSMKKHSFYFSQSDHDWILVDKGGYHHVLDRLEGYGVVEVPYEDEESLFLDESLIDSNPVETVEEKRPVTNEQRRRTFGKIE